MQTSLMSAVFKSKFQGEPAILQAQDGDTAELALFKLLMKCNGDATKLAPQFLNQNFSQNAKEAARRFLISGRNQQQLYEALVAEYRNKKQPIASLQCWMTQSQADSIRESVEDLVQQFIRQEQVGTIVFHPTYELLELLLRDDGEGTGEVIQLIQRLSVQKASVQVSQTTLVPRVQARFLAPLKQGALPRICGLEDNDSPRLRLFKLLCHVINGGQEQGLRSTYVQLEECAKAIKNSISQGVFLCDTLARLNARATPTDKAVLSRVAQQTLLELTGDQEFLEDDSVSLFLTQAEAESHVAYLSQIVERNLNRRRIPAGIQYVALRPNFYTLLMLLNQRNPEVHDTNLFLSDALKHLLSQQLGAQTSRRVQRQLLHMAHEVRTPIPPVLRVKPQSLKFSFFQAALLLFERADAGAKQLQTFRQLLDGQLFVQEDVRRQLAKYADAHAEEKLLGYIKAELLPVFLSDTSLCQDVVVRGTTLSYRALTLLCLSDQERKAQAELQKSGIELESLSGV